MTAYPVIGKAKSRDICAAFLQGVPTGQKGSVFYGVDKTNWNDWQRSRTSGEPYYYCDNSWFDKTRGTHFRITKDGLQHSGQGESSGERFKALALQIKPWREMGDHILVCLQSELFMRNIAEWKGDWLTDVLGRMMLSSERRFKVRPWDRDKANASATLPRDLKNAWALVTYSSAAAVTALLAGVPVACDAGACYSMGVTPLDVEDPLYPPDRERFFGVLADNQWTMDEMKDGTAWRMLNG